VNPVQIPEVMVGIDDLLDHRLSLGAGVFE
jgi:hypothetical protein